MKKRWLLSASIAVTLIGLGVQSTAQIQGLRIIAPAAIGGGWDQTARAIKAVLDSTKLASNVEVVNVPGSGGTIGLNQFVNLKGNENTLMVMGLVMVGAIQTNNSKANLDMVTPIARLTGEYEVIVVPSNSKIENLSEFISAWKTNTSDFVIAGGSAGGTDHIAVGLLGQNTGIDLRKINYQGFSGGGEVITAMQTNQVVAGVSGLSEFLPLIESGKLRAIGITSAKRLAGVSIPTFKEQGVRLEIANWRGIVAPPRISSDHRRDLVTMMNRLNASDLWQSILKQKNWLDLYQSGSRFDVFLKLEDEKVTNTLRGIGVIK
jgi:putative tricarboxylic transport membrane protein